MVKYESQRRMVNLRDGWRFKRGDLPEMALVDPGETGGVTLIAESDGLEPAEVSFTTG